MHDFYGIFYSIFWLLVIGAIVYAIVTRRRHEAEEKISPKIQYFYFTSFIGLVIAVCSLSHILGVSIGFLISDFQPSIDDKKILSLAFAFFIVAAPVWFLHWKWASSYSQGEGLDSVKSFRSKYIYLVMGMSGIVFLVFAGWVIYKIFNKILGVSDFDFHFFSRFLGFALINLGVWFYHWFLSKKDNLL